MLRNDFTWMGILGSIGVILFYPVTHDFVITVTKVHPYVMGFIKFAILATMGELLGVRIVNGYWLCPRGQIYRSCVWGLIGVISVITFSIYSVGVENAIKEGLLFGTRNGSAAFTTALWTSVTINVFFAPLLFFFHRITDTYLDLAEGNFKKLRFIKIDEVARVADLTGFIEFILLKTIPFFWIPAHTITFLLPPEYRILFAAFLSVALGGILAFAKRTSRVSYLQEQ